MVEDITARNVAGISNPAFRRYAQAYADIETDFYKAVEAFGLPFAEELEDVASSELAAYAENLPQLGVRVQNDGRSFVWGWISPACLTCRRGEGTETHLSSTQCPRHCFFCFNPNQRDYEYYLTHVHDMAAELQSRYDSGVHYVDLAVTGGEPLIHADTTVAFFRRAKTLYPQAYTRLYTSGSGLTPRVLNDLLDTGLQEIRFSIKLDEGPASVEETLGKLVSCVGRVPHVMVEMPVMPYQMSEMRDLLLRLDALGVDGINLLELCFPLHNAQEFASRGMLLKARPFRVVYDYLYAGGLPIHGSERACLQLVEFAAREKLRMGVHYCSLANKHTSQIYQQNTHIHVESSLHAMSERDCFLKSAKAFGTDCAKAERILRRCGETRMARESYDDVETLEFPIEDIALLASDMPDMEIAVSVCVAEMRGSAPVLREVALQRTTAASFDTDCDW